MNFPGGRAGKIHFGGEKEDIGPENTYPWNVKPLLIRNEAETDWAAVHALNVAAFETPAEAKRFGISCEYEVPAEVFMVVELQPGFLHAASGRARYHAAFSNV